MIHKAALYLRMVRSQLLDRNAERALSLRQRLWRGHRLGTCAVMLLQPGPPYRAPRWMRRERRVDLTPPASPKRLRSTAGWGNG